MKWVKKRAFKQQQLQTVAMLLKNGHTKKGPALNDPRGHPPVGQFIRPSVCSGGRRTAKLYKHGHRPNRTRRWVVTKAFQSTDRTTNKRMNGDGSGEKHVFGLLIRAEKIASAFCLCVRSD
ncbi:hypothetical protein niasHS_015499 [Heterodera schachtii]|uniref:Uncharacterized protein n=1 Tax=Heterodera schachtii TaxID=97005 RepID=A0ABD2I739_HETSC